MHQFFNAQTEELESLSGLRKRLNASIPSATQSVGDWERFERSSAEPSKGKVRQWHKKPTRGPSGRLVLGFDEVEVSPEGFENEKAQLLAELRRIDKEHGPRYMREIALASPEALHPIAFEKLRGAEVQAKRLRGRLRELTS